MSPIDPNCISRRSICSSLFAAAVSGCARSSSGTSDSVAVRMGLPRNPIFYLPAYLAEELGYYREEGLRVSVQDLPGGTKNVEAMLGGSADVIGAVYEHTLWLAADGKATKCFLLLIDRPGLMLLVAPGAEKRIRTIADLKGAAVGVATPGSQSHMFVNYLLHRNGLTPDDIRTVGIGLGAGSVVAFERGKVDAAAVSGSAISVLQRRHPGLTVLAEACTPEGVNKIYGNDTYPAHALLAPSEWLERNAQTARKLARANQRASGWMREHRPEEIQAKLPRAFRLEDAASELDAIRMALPMYSMDGRVRPEGAQAVKRALDVTVERVRLSKVDFSQTYTDEFLQDG